MSTAQNARNFKRFTGFMAIASFVVFAAGFLLSNTVVIMIGSIVLAYHLGAYIASNELVQVIEEGVDKEQNKA